MYIAILNYPILIQFPISYFYLKEGRPFELRFLMSITMKIFLNFPFLLFWHNFSKNSMTCSFRKEFCKFAPKGQKWRSTPPCPIEINFVVA